MGITSSRRMLLAAIVLSALMASGLAFSTSGATEEERSYVLATARAGGTFYPAGTALATVITVKLRPVEKITLQAIRSGGSYENARLLRQNKVDFALMNALVGHYTWAGQGPFAADGPHETLRSVAAFWQNVDHYVVKKEYAKTGTIEDMRGLKGKRVLLGIEGSGTRRSSRFLLGNLGIDVDNELDLVEHSSLDQGVRALLFGQIEALAVESGVPVAAVTQAKGVLGDELVILDFTDTQMARAQGGLNLWTRRVIEAGTYPGQAQDINTIALSAYLAVRADVDEAAVYQITKTIYENLAFLQSVHGVFAATRLDKALAGLPAPLHPGALRYYREAGLSVPARLVVE